MDQLIESDHCEALETLKRAASSPPIGEWLIHEKLITEERLQEALHFQRLHGGRVGDILAKKGAISLFALYRTLAKQQKISLVNLVTDPPEPALFDPAHLQAYLQLQAVPYGYQNDRLVVATSDVKRFTAQQSQIFGDTPVLTVLTSPRDIYWTLERIFGTYFTERASQTLREEWPHYALHQPNTDTGSITPYIAAIASAAAVWQFPSVVVSAILIFFSLFFISILSFKLLLMRRGWKVREAVTAKCDIPLAEFANCPTYTVLVPLYKEAEAVPDLLKSLSALDYPPDRLDIKLITEFSDHATRQAIIAQKPDARFHLINVPSSLPQTKPKACNYALQFAAGEFVTIYDAEDAPSPSQLRHAVALFQAYPEVGCLQACLNYYNARENLLTRLFSLEYAMLFNVMLPALFSLNIPIPLGGTSNHVRRSVLEALGAWDAYNVTEDADLGVRLASEGYITLPFPSLTREEAPVTIKAWLKQRARWIKGYIQTWTVLARTPAIRRLQLGNAGFWGIHFFIGAASFSYMVSPFLWIATLCWLFLPPVFAIPLFVQYVCWFTLALSACVQWGSAAMMRREEEYAPSWFTILCWPAYFMLHSVASVRSLWQLVFAPYHWDKTTHNRTKVKRTV